MRQLVDPQLIPLFDQIPTLDISGDNLAAIRSLSPLVGSDGAVHSSVVLDVRSVPGPIGAPDIQIWIYRPNISSNVPCILHIHGGGFIAGDAAQYELRHRQLAEELSCCIASVNYRLAPETPYPGAIDDCYAALSWVFSHAGDLQVDADRIGVMGESAGGGLAAALALMARDKCEFKLAFQHLIYPMLDDRTCVSSDPHPFVGQYVWNTLSNRFGWRSLLGQEPGGDDVSPYAAPARASDLSGLPPTFVGTAALDLFLEENLEWVRRLSRAGVPVELHVYPAAFHAFDVAPDAEVAVRARRESVDALRRALTSTQ